MHFFDRIVMIFGMPEWQIVPESSDSTAPLVGSEHAGPELSVRAVALGIFLAAILGAANAYLGLKAGMTVSASARRPRSENRSSPPRSLRSRRSSS